VPDWQQRPETCAVRQQGWALLERAIARGINAPLASSCGRLFDAVACALGIVPERQSYEGEAACRLEALAARCAGVEHPVTLAVENLALFWQQWLNWQAGPSERAWAFHDALAKGLAELAARHARRLSLSTICLSGGVLHNRLLCARLRHYLSDFTLLFPHRLPSGDGGNLVRTGRCCRCPDMFTKDLKMLRLLRNEPRAAALLLALIMANLLAWGWAWHSFSGSTALMAASLLAWGYGLRHAVDADHIAAIDTVTRKMMQQGKRPSGVGAWFSLGHSTIVVLASIAIAATATAFQKNMAWFHETGSLIGTAVSATFLLAMALVNMVILRGVWRSFQALKNGREVSDAVVPAAQGGAMSWLFGKTFRLVNKSWHMYLVGFLFGLGFDTATEIGVLGISAASASHGMSIWSIMVFPALFASGMALVDTLDNLLMVGAYGWAFNKPQRKLYYNMTITGTSVVVALFIGGLEALGLLMDKFGLSGGLWDAVAEVK